jgi:hypothetical protein
MARVSVFDASVTAQFAIGAGHAVRKSTSEIRTAHRSISAEPHARADRSHIFGSAKGVL